MFYTSYKCKRCNKEIILITAEVEDSQFRRNYIACSHCGSKKLHKEKITDDLRDVMNERKYKRVNGAIRQVTK